jgi:hypothetical protein
MLRWDHDSVFPCSFQFIIHQCNVGYSAQVMAHGDHCDVDIFMFIAVVCVPLTEQQSCEDEAKCDPTG